MSVGNKYDVIVIGAGPAGATTAIACAKKGLKVLVLDREVFPRAKACGDNLTSIPLRILERLGLKELCDEIAKASNGIPLWSCELHGTANIPFTMQYKPLYKGTEKPSCYAITREKFDHLLLSEAKKQTNVEVKEGVSVSDINFSAAKNQTIVSTELGDFYTHKIVFACGSNAPIMRRVRNDDAYPKRHKGIGIRAYFKGVAGFEDSNKAEGYLIKDLMPGGIYLTPMPDGLVNVNVVMRADMASKHRINLRSQLIQIINRHPKLKERFINAEMVGKPIGSGLEYGTVRRKIAGDYWLAVGDAAGLVDLASANGIANALDSAVIASDFLHKTLALNHIWNEKLYTEQVYASAEKKLKNSLMLAPMLRYEWMFAPLNLTINTFLRVNRLFRQKEAA